MNKRELIRYIQDQKTGPCEDCGRIYPYWVMQFDHVNGEKLFNISDVGRHLKVPLFKVQEEIAKCDLLCANCHHIRTHSNSLKRPIENVWNRGFEIVNRPLSLDSYQCKFCEKDVRTKPISYLADSWRTSIFCSIECFTEETRRKK